MIENGEASTRYPIIYTNKVGEVTVEKPKENHILVDFYWAESHRMPK